MKQPSIQLAALASLIIHAAAFMLLVYIANKHPQFTMPKAYTVNLVSVPKTSPANLPSQGEPPKAPEPEKKEPEVKEPEKQPEAKPVKPEPEKPAKTELKEPEVKKEVKPEKPKKPAVEKDKGKEPPAAKTKDKKPEKPKETPKPEQVKPSKKETPKEETTSVEDRIAALKAKRKIQQHAMQRAVVDVGASKVKQGQRTTGAGEGAMPSTGNVITDEYAAAVSAHIRKRWIYPESGKKGLLAVVTFTIRRNGQIENVQLEKKSGNAFYDRSALAAVTKSVPMPQPPQDYFEFGVNFKDDF